MKEFKYRVYTKNGLFIQDIDEDLIESSFNFSANINGSQGELNIILNVPFEDNIIEKGNFIKVFIFSEDFPDGYNLYTGRVEKIKRTLTSGIEQVNVIVLGLGSIFTNTSYKNGGSSVFNKTGTSSSIIKDVVDYLNTIYGGWFSYTNDSIETTTISRSIDLNYTNCFDVLKRLSELEKFNFYIDASGVVYFKSKNSAVLWNDNEFWNDDEFWNEFYTEHHTLTRGLDLDTLEVEEDCEKIINRYILEWKSGTLSPVEDIVSQNLYGVRELKESKTDIADITTAQDYANSFIEKNKDPKTKTFLVINNKYVFEKIIPLELISILNTNYSIKELQIQKIQYDIDKMKIYLEDFNTISKEIFNI